MIIHKGEWQNVAKENTIIYERVFRGKIDPTNHIASTDGISDWRVSVHVHFHIVYNVLLFL